MSAALAAQMKTLGDTITGRRKPRSIEQIVEAAAVESVARNAKLDARRMIANRWMIARALPPDLRFNEPLSAQIAWARRALTAERVAIINGTREPFGRAVGMGFVVWELKVLNLVLRYLRRFPGSV